MTDTAAAKEKDSPKRATNDNEERVIVRTYPKIIVMYPTVVFAILCGMIMLFIRKTTAEGAASDPGIARLCGLTFIFLLTLNLIVMSFDFPRMAAVSMFLLLVVGFVTGLLMQSMGVPIWAIVSGLLNRFDIVGNASMYFSFAAAFLLIYAIAWAFTRFDYWEITPNELLHHHGPFGDLERFPSPNLKLDKELHDVFEYIILRSGRLILYPTSERRAIVLDNILGIHEVERRIKGLLSAMEVRIDTTPET